MVVVGGGMRVDYLITHEGKAHSGLIGGNAVYAAVGAALWHDDIALWGRVGQNYPHAWLTNLAQFGIQIDGVKEIHGEHDHRTFYAYTPEGVRDDTNHKRTSIVSAGRCRQNYWAMSTPHLDKTILIYTNRLPSGRVIGPSDTVRPPAFILGRSLFGPTCYFRLSYANGE